MRQVLKTDYDETGRWWAYDTDMNAVGCRSASGASEDIAVSNWWAKHNLAAKHPRKHWVGYVAHDLVNPEVVEHTEELA